MNKLEEEVFKSKRNRLIKSRAFEQLQDLEKEYLRMYPDNCEALCMAAWTAESVNDLKYAEELLRRAYNLNPGKYVGKLIKIVYKLYNEKVAYDISRGYIDSKLDDLAHAFFSKRTNGWRPDNYSTHQPLLIPLICATRGPILEIGGGWYSSPLLKAIAQVQKRKVITVETSKFVAHAIESFESQYYKVMLLDGFNFSNLGKFENNDNKPKKYYIDLQDAFFRALVSNVEVERWSVIFIDHRPGFLRAPAISLFCDMADYVVTHDTEAVQHYSFLDAFNKFKYVRHCKWFKPFTTVMSNYNDLSHIDPLLSLSAEDILDEVLVNVGIKNDISGIIK